MIHFVDMRRENIPGSRFAFFDTVTDEFVNLGPNCEAWDSQADLEGDFQNQTPAFRKRLLDLIPEWALYPSEATL